MRRGFTLTEILVAVIILAICILGILPLIVVATRAHKTSVENSFAVSIAKVKMAELQEALDNSHPMAQKIIADIKKSAKVPKTAVIAPQTVPGFSELYKVGVEVSELAPQDPAQSGFLAVIRVRWLPEGQPDNDDDIGRIWIFRSVLMKKSDHKDFVDATATAAPPPLPSRPKSYDPVVEWLGDAVAKLPDATLKPPDDKLLQQTLAEAMAKQPRPWAGNWETALSQKGAKGLALFQKQPLSNFKDPNGKSLWAMSGLVTYFPFAASGLKNPRMVQIVKRDVYIDGKPSDMNGHPFVVEGGEPFYAQSKAAPRGTDEDSKDLADTGVMAWGAPGISNPWSTAQRYDLRISWTLYSWIVCSDGEGKNVPVGYFSWRVTLSGTVGIGPLDTKLTPNLDVVTFIEADGKAGQGADHVLQKALEKK